MTTTMTTTNGINMAAGTLTLYVDGVDGCVDGLGLVGLCPPVLDCLVLGVKGRHV